MKVLGVIVVVVVLGFIILAAIGSTMPPQQSSNDQVIQQEIDRLADLCKNGHMEACDQERTLATLHQQAQAGGVAQP
jgi:hypothetical protein